ncbi:DNA-directed RNA polymerase subunit beta' [Candidatus Uhrbacteria bacterium]|nr:DNA-directed RNA polymerase subunit beta' [Candidatus Uhrbacteria bacterium]
MAQRDERKDTVTVQDFDAIRLKVASPDDIHRWSYGEVTRPETINYRTQRPEKDGLFSERIFGPTKDWECYCGKYKKIRYKGIVCDKCGVEVTRSIVRRERMGHIDLAAPVSHIWFLRGVPSKIGLALDLSVQNLEKVIYFASFIITDVNEDLKKETLVSLREEYKTKRKSIEQEYSKKFAALGETEKGKKELERGQQEAFAQLDERMKLVEDDLKTLKPYKIVSEQAYRDMSLKYGHVFEASIGAESIRKLLERIDLKALEKHLDKEVSEAQGMKKERLIRRAKLIKSFIANNIRPEWMIATSIPIIPPDLRPMVALDGGRFATSDLNDLYRRVINRNNRLKQLVELKAPEVICRNEKRMLQEAVDALIDNSARHGKTVIASTGKKRTLKSLADMLKGKRGRFRQNLLGKRIDYSGRSVIVVGPHLKLHECGLPKTMALDLFKPFVISRLIQKEYVHNVRSATRFIESGWNEVWDILEEIVRDSYVMLNRAPTLHRLGIQAFKPVLIEGKAIQIHPLVCSAFNADFDGDQMAVHVPLSDEAREEAQELMLASKNLLKPATGHPIAMPSQDIVWGAYYMTWMSEEQEKRSQENIKKFTTEEELLLAHSHQAVNLNEKVIVRLSSDLARRAGVDRLETTLGRILFNNIFPVGLPYWNVKIDKKTMGEIVSLCLDVCGVEETARILDDIKEVCAHHLTQSGLSFGMDDIPLLDEKPALIKEVEKKIDEVQSQYEMGLLTFQERKNKIITLWTEVRDKISKLSKKVLKHGSSVETIIDSGARGTWAQLNQIIGMKGLLANPSGEIIELAVKSSFKEGLGVLEYFISTHGARKGLVDTALRTSNAGYLTRRLVDVSQDVVITEQDCQDKEGLAITAAEGKEIDLDFYDRLFGRVASATIKAADGTILVKRNECITKELVVVLRESGIENATIRTLLTCKSIHGVCQKCYGYDPAYNKPVALGTAVGIIAAQSLGEPGTQLTMRTFHTGGVAGSDITQGLPRVEELFESRIPKVRAVISEVAGTVSISTKQRSVVDESGKEVLKSAGGQKVVAVHYDAVEEDTYRFRITEPPEEESEGVEKTKKRTAKKILVAKDGMSVAAGDLLATVGSREIRAERGGMVKMKKEFITVAVEAKKIKEYLVPANRFLLAKEGELVAAGTPLTEGSLDLQLLYRYRGVAETQRYIIREIQRIYFSQGQKLNDKHIEVIVRQMFSRVYVTDAGDTSLLPGEIVERSEFLDENIHAAQQSKEPAKGENLLMGITKSSLSTQSWLSAASFQETARVLINAAVTGKVDYLQGLKENVIIGRLIPVGTGYRHHTNGKEA